PVLQEAYEEGHELVMLPCQHEFHAACVKSWLHRSPTCPSCRHELESQPVTPRPIPDATCVRRHVQTSPRLT
ncbi:hypothetical protein T484DRAFT_1628281, partial [Baffinella frigidus]